MQLADAAWVRAVPGEPPTADLWGLALADVRRQTDTANESLFARSSASDQKVLRLVAGRRPLFGGAGAVLDLSPSAAQASRERLVDLGEIARRGSTWSVVDPIYGDWIRRRFPL